MNGIPDAAIEAAACAVWRPPSGPRTYSDRLIWDTLPQVALDEARAAIEAAMPAIREAIAQEIEAHYCTGAECPEQRCHGARNATRIVRGGKP